MAEAYIEIGTRQSQLDAGLASAKSKLLKLAGMRFNLPGGGFAAMFGGAVLAATIQKTISGASDLAETVSKVGTVFGDQAGLVTKAADQMADSFGTPKREFLDSASQFGLIAIGMGESKDAAAALSIKFAKLAADASSFYNIDYASALEKLRAGLTGEAEPLKSLGVIMDETTMKAEALRMGLGKEGQELSNQAKFAARASLIQKGLAAATGDLARTMDGASNQGRKFWGMLTNLGDTIGTTLLPPVNAFLHLLNDVATDISAAAASGSGAWSGFMSTIVDGVDNVSLIYRQWGNIVERTGVMIGGSLQNVGEYFGHLQNTVAAFLQWFSDNWSKVVRDTINESKKAVAGAMDFIKNPEKAAGQAMAAMIRGGDPLQEAMLGGANRVVIPQFNAPKLQLSDVAPQLAAIDAKMAQGEGDRAGKAAAAIAAAKAGGKAGAVPGGAGGGPGGGLGGGGSSRYGVTDEAGYARELADAAARSGVDAATAPAKPGGAGKAAENALAEKLNIKDQKFDAAIDKQVPLLEKIKNALEKIENKTPAKGQQMKGAAYG